MLNDLREYYLVLELELEPTATFTDVKRAYRDLVKVWHPDRFAHEPSLERKAQEKLKQINLAFEVLERFFAQNEGTPGNASKAHDTSESESVFVQGHALFFGNGVAKDTAKAAFFLRKSAGMGFAPAQYLLGHIFYMGDGLAKSENDACAWWTKAAEQLHAEAQYSLGCLYHKGHKSSLLEKIVKSTVDWRIGDSKIEAYKWLNLAITYGVGLKGGLAKEAASTCMIETQRNEARKRAAVFYPRYPQSSPEAVFDQLFDWFLEEGNAPAHMELHKVFSNMTSKTGGIEKLRVNVCDKGLEHLRNTFLGDPLAKTGGYFKAMGSAWNFNRSSEDWGRLIARSLLEFPYDYLSDTFIQRRENSINHIWLSFVNA